MFDAPRCREWTPLATQQLRLRSLIQIVGYNIRPPEHCPSPHSYYYTLHATSMSAPFYTSERIASPHPKWRELHADLTQRMSSTNVVIRIWCHLQPPDGNETGDKLSDVIIQTWGVYFSGLRLIGANLALDFTSDSFKGNTLVFQMHGGYFCSYKSLNLEVIPSENLYELNSVSLGSSEKSDASRRIPIEAHYLQNYRIINESRSISPSKRSHRTDLEYSKSHSPTERGFKQSFAQMKPSASLNISDNKKDFKDNRIVDPDIYEHSPDNLDVRVLTMSDLSCDISKHPSREELYRSHIDLSETAENFDLRNDPDIPKCRYLCLNFLKSEIRPSYNATRLQRLHLLQYGIKKRKEAVQEIKERIYKKSALEIQAASADDLKVVTRLKRPQRHLFESELDNDMCSVGDKAGSPDRGRKMAEDMPPANGRLTLKLNDLLSYKTRPSPHQRSEHARLTRQLEVLRFKRALLSDERDRKLGGIRRLKERHARMYEENQDTGTELMQSYHSLSRRSEQLRQARQSTAALRELATRASGALAARQNRLLSSLQEVFCVDTVDETWRICGIPLPIFGDEGGRRAGASDAAAAGLAAQCCGLAAALLARPLRYPIVMLGSATRIVDHLTPDLPDPQIPLYPRGGDSALFRYAMFLLNKCVAQLLWGCGRPVVDVRPTLANLQRLLAAGDRLRDAGEHARGGADGACAHSQSLRSLVACERGKHRQFNRFKDCVDSHVAGSAQGLWRHRQSRSVGSYRDDREIGNMDMSTTSIMGSEPFLYATKMTGSDERLSKRSSLLKTHNSDSEISRVSQDVSSGQDAGKVVFTLGGDTNLRDMKPVVVKLSSNNGECEECMDDNVMKICSEITDYWPKPEDGQGYSKGMLELKTDSQDVEVVTNSEDLPKRTTESRSSHDIEEATYDQDIENQVAESESGHDTEIATYGEDLPKNTAKSKSGHDSEVSTYNHDLNKQVTESKSKDIEVATYSEDIPKLMTDFDSSQDIKVDKDSRDSSKQVTETKNNDIEVATYSQDLPKLMSEFKIGHDIEEVNCESCSGNADGVCSDVICPKDIG